MKKQICQLDNHMILPQHIRYLLICKTDLFNAQLFQLFFYEDTYITQIDTRHAKNEVVAKF